MATSETRTPALPAAAAAQTVFQLATGYIMSAALHVALRLKIADELADGPRSVEVLAEKAGVEPDPLYRVLRALASVGVFEEHASRRFALNPAAELLRSAPGTLHDLALFLTDKLHFQVHSEMMHSVATGRPAVELVTGVSGFEFFERDRQESELFNNAMTSLSAAVVPAALKAYDFSGLEVVADIAGGHGFMLASILREYPSMRGILLDLDHVVAGAPARLASMGVADRCQVVAGNFFENIPSGADAYLMKHIIHDWDDDRALAILRNVRTALEGRANGRCVLIEAVLVPGNQPDLGKIGDLEMLVFPGGRERSAEEFMALFARAGFELTRIVPTESPMCVIEARPV